MKEPFDPSRGTLTNGITSPFREDREGLVFSEKGRGKRCGVRKADGLELRRGVGLRRFFCARKGFPGFFPPRTRARARVRLIARARAGTLMRLRCGGKREEGKGKRKGVRRGRTIEIC